MPKFVIPQRDDDLLEASEGVFYVSELVTEIDDIMKAINRFQSLTNKQEFEQVLEFFDEFFAIARHNEELGYDIRVQAFDVLAKGLANFTTPLRNHVSDVMNSPALTDELCELNEKYRNCLLMYIYLLSRISYQIEAYVSKKTRSANADQKGKKAVADPAEDYTVSFWNSIEGRLRLLRLLFGVTTIEAVGENGSAVRAGIKFLFTPNILNEQLVNSILSIVIKILENPEASKASGKNILIASFHVLRAACIGWEQSNIVAMNLMELAARLEYFQKPGVTSFHFVDCILLLQLKDELRPLLSEMIKYLGKFDPTSFAGDTSAKAFCLFITTLAEKDPHTLLKNMAPLMSFLSYDPPTLRNAMLTAFSDIASKCSEDEEENQSFEKQRRAMLTRLQDHIQDTAAVVRTRILHVWEKLAIKQAIPNEQFRFLLVTDIGNRLKDNSVMVRKAAVSALRELVSHNRFGSDLSYEKIFKRLIDNKKKHAEMTSKNPEFDSLQEMTKKFESEIEPAVRTMLDLCLNEFLLSDSLPSMEQMNRNLAMAAHQKSFSFLQNGSEDGSMSDEENEIPYQITVENIANEAVSLTRISSMILDTEQRLAGCMSYLRMYMEQNNEEFQRDMDVPDTVEKLCRCIRNLLLQYSVSQNVNDQNEEHFVVEEDRIEEYQRQLIELEKRIESNLDQLFFAKGIEACLPDVVYCVKRGQVPEIQDMIKFICECCKFKIRGGPISLKDIFHLIWRKDAAITEIIIEAGYEAIFNSNPNVDVSSKVTARNLINIMLEANDEEKVSLEETLTRVIAEKGISQQTVDIIWDKTNDEDIKQRLIAIRLLGVIAKSYLNDQKQMIRLQLGRLIKLYKNKEKSEAIRLEVLRIIVSLSSSSEKEEASLGRQVFRVPSSDKLIKAMLAFLISDLRSEKAELWIPHCREVVNALFGICARPNRIISVIFQKMTFLVKESLHQHNTSLRIYNNLIQRIEKLSSPREQRDYEDVVDNDRLEEAEEIRLLIIKKGCYEKLISATRSRMELCASRLLYFVGEVALKFLTYLEVTFTRELKVALQLIHDIRLMDISVAEEENFVLFDAQKDAPLIQFEKDCIRQRGFFEKADREDDRIGLTAISEEEKLHLKLQKILDKDTFGSSTINGRILPFVLLVLKGHLIMGESLKEAAIQCLAKLMLVNRKCCKRFLPLFFNFYDHSSVRARNNMIILMTDLCFRFPNVFNLFNNEFIRKIRDENSGIRYTCLLVLSHMLLNDLIKISGRIAEIAPCLCDEDPRIQKLARGFFTEMSKKHNVLYNMMPDIISKLTTNKDMTIKEFEEVMRFLLSFISAGKDQQKESLVEKLCQRFQLLKTHSSTGCIPLPEALSFCIAQIPLNERIFRRLVENFRFYQEFLHFPQVMKYFTAVLAAFKKNSLKSLELKAQIEEFEAQIQNAHVAGEVDEENED